MSKTMYECPTCGTRFVVSPDDADQELTCPTCGAVLMISAVEDTDASKPEVELDGARIRKLAALRRSTYRSRSYAIIAAILCAVGAVQAGYLLARELQFHHLSTWSMLLLVILALVIFLTILFARKAVALDIEMRRREQHPTLPAPDF